MRRFKTEQVWHPWYEWEEIAHNMWGTVDDRRAMLKRAVVFTGDHVLYGSFMERVIVEWPISCENALTDPHLGHRSWIGHAACALAMHCPEDIVRQAWGVLSSEQKLLANQKADGAVAAWRYNRQQGIGVGRTVDEQMLLRWTA
jgi:hypothetical protein